MAKAAVMLKLSQTAAGLLVGDMEGVLASMEGLSGFSNQGCRCCYIEHLYVSYFGSRCEHVDELKSHLFLVHFSV